MNSQYYYFDAEGQTVCGPFGLQDIWALHTRTTLTVETLICRAGFEEWQPLSAYPELLPPPAPEKPAPPPPPMLSLPPRPEAWAPLVAVSEPLPAPVWDEPEELSPPVLTLPPRIEVPLPASVPEELPALFTEEPVPSALLEPLPAPVTAEPVERPEPVVLPPPQRVLVPRRSHKVPILAAIGGFLVLSGICYFSLTEQNNVADAVLSEHTVSAGPLSDHSWDDGYGEGYDFGKENFQRGLPLPPAAELHADASLACRAQVHPLKEALWVEGYEEGYAAGYKEAAAPPSPGH